MGEHDARTYGRLWAEDYDLIFPGFDPAQIDLLANLAGDPPRALELAIGTGRLALPLRSARAPAGFPAGRKHDRSVHGRWR